MKQREFVRASLICAIISMLNFASGAQTVVSEKIINATTSDEKLTIYSIDDKELNGVYKIYGYNDDYELVSFKNGIKNGEVAIFSYEDDLKCEGRYNNGSADGEWVFYDTERGIISAVRVYKNGKADGMWKEFDRRSKTPVKEETYDNGMLTEMREYNLSGDRKSESFYKNGLRIGNWKEYHRDNILRSSTNYDLNIKEGLFEQFNSEGKIQLRGQFKNNKHVGEWLVYYDDGNIYSKRKQNGDKWDFETFHENGKLKEKGIAIDFKLTLYDGKHTEYYENGKIKQESNFLNGSRHGSYVLYRENGTKQEEGTYNMGDRAEYKRYE